MSFSVHTLRVTLEWSDPPIWREIVVPSEFSLGDLHWAIQLAFGWSDSHLHHFELKTGNKRGDRVYFCPSEVIDEMDSQDEDEVTIEEVCPRGSKKLTYTYDMGDDWRHLIEVRKIATMESSDHYLTCLKGTGATPPEDCGGMPRYEMLLKDLKSSGEDQEEASWVLGEDFDPSHFDLAEVNANFTSWRNAIEKHKKKQQNAATKKKQKSKDGDPAR